MSQKIGIAALMGGLLFSQSASALSCVEPNLVQTLEEVKASETVYYVLAGRFVPAAAQTPRRGYNPIRNRNNFQQNKEITRVRFEGVSLASSPARDQALQQFPIDVETSCMGPWCSSLPNASREFLAFVEARDGQPPLLRVGPCPKFVYPTSSRHVETVRTLLSSHP
jgi:hypothetical protein